MFYAVEDIYVPDAKNEIMEDLKPMITGKQLEIEAKGSRPGERGHLRELFFQLESP